MGHLQSAGATLSYQMSVLSVSQITLSRNLCDCEACNELFTWVWIQIKANNEPYPVTLGQREAPGKSFPCPGRKWLLHWLSALSCQSSLSGCWYQTLLWSINCTADQNIFLSLYKIEKFFNISTWVKFEIAIWLSVFNPRYMIKCHNCHNCALSDIVKTSDHITTRFLIIVQPVCRNHNPVSTNDLISDPVVLFRSLPFRD